MPIRPAYLKTLFIPKEPGENQPAPDWSRPFAILTAFNPGGQLATEERNQEQNRLLRQKLSRGKYAKHKVDAVSEDWTHTEKSFAVWGLAPSAAAALGLEFGQDAYFWVQGGTVHVHSCQTSENQKVGSWKTRLRKRHNRFAIRIYVLQLDPAVLEEPNFAAQNPGCGKDPGRGCLYVGSTDNVEKRIRIHRFGPGPGDNPRVRGSGLVSNYFRGRRHDLEPPEEYLTSGHATLAEALEAEFLRDAGYRVYSN